MGTSPLFGQTSCDENDHCVDAIPLGFLSTNIGFVCVEGCNTGTTSDVIDEYCISGDVPSVWYRLDTDDSADVVNIAIQALEDQLLVFMLFKAEEDCDSLTPVPITPSGLYCSFGINGYAEGMGSDIDPLSTYYIVVGSVFNTAGAFELCVSVMAEASNCVTDREVVITHRSNGGPLEGPFYADETIGICLNVYEFTAASNGCQWFQGLVPVFGNGWDPASFTPDGQPLNATINGVPIGQMGNGLYGASTWDWFDDVGYHYDHGFFQIGDFDNNGTLDMCHTMYDPSCPDVGGLLGGCCGPCWLEEPGHTLPGGWFAYGINGSCPQPGPPISVDWGDGNSCGAGMGPWQFCFELKTRDILGCSMEPNGTDLSVGFVSFADGEVGAWSGSASVCGKDQPINLELPYMCAEPLSLAEELMVDICPGDTFTYVIEEQGVDFWSWTVTPSEGMQTDTSAGPNGHVIHATFDPPASSYEVVYTFIGRLSLSFNTVVKKVRFTVLEPMGLEIPNTIFVCRGSDEPVTVFPQGLTGGNPPYSYYWAPGGDTSSVLIVDPPPTSDTQVSLQITDQSGCTVEKVIDLTLKNCLIDKPEDEHFPPIKPGPVPPQDGVVGGEQIIGDQPLSSRSSASLVKVFPVPASESVYLEWHPQLGTVERLVVSHMDGTIMSDVRIREGESRRRELYVQGWPSGIYVLTLFTKDTVHTSRMIKQ